MRGNVTEKTRKTLLNIDNIILKEISLLIGHLSSLFQHFFESHCFHKEGLGVS